jgi:hypothetical protein
MVDEGKEGEEDRTAAICVLDDPSWRPLIETYKRLLPHARTSTAFEVMAKLKSGELPCVRRSKTNPSQYDPVLASFWTGRELDADYLRYFDELYIYGTDVVTGLRDPGTRLDAEEFYVQEPEKVWRVLASQAIKENAPEEGEPLPRRPGRKPKGNWKVEVATEVGLHMREGKPIPTAKALAEFCRDDLDCDVDIREIQRWLRELGC